MSMLIARSNYFTERLVFYDDCDAVGNKYLMRIDTGMITEIRPFGESVTGDRIIALATIHTGPRSPFVRIIRD